MEEARTCKLGYRDATPCSGGHPPRTTGFTLRSRTFPKKEQRTQINRSRES